MEYIVELRNISKSYNKNKILESIDLSVPRGSLIGVIGKSGSGKSTLLNIIGLLESPDQGQVFYNGKLVEKINSKEANKIIRNHIAYLFQNYALIENETVRDNIKIALKYRSDLKKKDIDEEISKLLKEVGLENYEDRFVYSLSGGEQQRVALAKIIAKPFDIILADEPTGNLDDTNARMVMEILLKQREKGKSILMVTHDTSLLEFFDQIIELT